ncbi:hypothetical protein J6T21_03915 [Candidatus Saccharibacteria bacterium]|nr:hypothetical protein [Candidatus Saccharibacteria bacterium]
MEKLWVALFAISVIFMMVSLIAGGGDDVIKKNPVFFCLGAFMTLASLCGLMENTMEMGKYDESILDTDLNNPC